MSRRGGLPGMGGKNMNNMMKQMQKMQEDLMKAQAEAEEKEFTVTVGGGAVEVVINGKRELQSITLDEMVVDPEDIEMLQDLILSAVNEAYRQAEEHMERPWARSPASISRDLMDYYPESVIGSSMRSPASRHRL